jgi:hypothetical protein
VGAGPLFSDALQSPELYISRLLRINESSIILTIAFTYYDDQHYLDFEALTYDPLRED